MGVTPMILAMFDLDGTILSGDSDYAWNMFLIEQGHVDPDHYLSKNDHYYQQYLKGELEIYEYQKFTLSAVSRYSVHALEEIRQQYFEEKVLPMIKEKAKEKIDWHQSLGHVLLLISATSQFIIIPVGRHLGFRRIMGCIPQIKGQHFTGHLIGTPSFREGKCQRIREWMRDNDVAKSVLSQSYFYGDSLNDQFVMDMVGNPIAIDPDPYFTQHAKKKRWKIENWEKS